MYEVQFIREGITEKAVEGERLLDVMRRAGLTPDAPCGGQGRCGKCLVKLCNFGDRVVKSCQFLISDDLTVDTMGGSASAQILTAGISRRSEFDPGLRRLQIRVPPCPEGESVSDWSRFAESLRRAAGLRGEILAEPALASRLGPILKKTGGLIWAVFFENQVLEVSEEQPPYYMAAFDIGTTTVAGYLLRGEDGKEAAVASRMNPQVQYGADVINRANYSLENGMDALSGCIRKTVNEMLAEMAEAAQAETGQIYLVSMAGNTCMHHLFLGICVDSLVHAPYNPAVSEAMILRSADYGIQTHPRGRLLILPNIAGFVGADTVACLIASDLAAQKDWTLLIDIGTNGEVVLGKEGRMIACSTAAGPAFEGSRISRGMRGAPGAINSVRWEKGEWQYTTIGGKKPRGICGSGLLDLAAQMWQSGQMDENGIFSEGKEILIAKAEETEDGKPITLTQKDIGELQLAKAAIAAGVRLLAEQMSIPLEAIQQVWLAGAFGSYLSPESACGIGLISPKLRGRIRAIGNAAGEGAKAVLRSRKLWEQASEQAQETAFLELAGMARFQDYFIDELEFPEQPGQEEEDV